MTTVPGFKVTGLISESFRTMMYRAIRLDDQKPVILKILRPDQATAENIEMLRHDSDVSSRIQLDGLVKWCGYENGELGPVLVLEDFGAVPLTELISSSGLSLDLFFTVAACLTSVLTDLHRLGIIHKEINPANILINRESGTVKLTGLGLSGPGPGADRVCLPLSSLAYSSPEQTGRMNRDVDHRTDLYSLGVTFYQLLSGRLPFSAEDPAELIHCHLAREPEPLRRLNPRVPDALSDIVMKLLAKDPAGRYQSGYGLLADLETCREQEKAGIRERFTLGLHDVPHTFSTAKRLFGRERELADLTSAVDRVQRGAKELQLVSGLPGIGKTALIEEFRKPLAACMSLFSSGKFDLSKRYVPYSGFILAFKGLIRRILTMNEQEVHVWKERLLHALGANGQIIIRVIPELELIIGRQPSPSEVGPVESLNRFNRTIRNFVGVFARREHPLVLFLDDLQWADPGSLNLVKILLADPQIDHFLLIGAFRENEVDRGHPLQSLLDDVAQTPLPIHRIHLPPLTVQLVNELISAALRCAPEQSESLARIVHAKTGGSPFFVNQMLLVFSNEKMLHYDPARGWSWSVEEIGRLNVTGNVIDLLIGKIGKLAPASQEVLKLAACIGNRFDLETLEMVYEHTSARTFADLGPAVQEGLVVASRDSYAFFHDRIHEALYSLIPAEETKRIRYRIGTQALERTKKEQLHDKVFYLADHLNAGADLIADEADRYRLAELNLMAGKKAKASAAYESAVRYLSKGIALLAGSCWSARYELSMDLHRECSECRYLSGNFDEAEHLFSVIEQNARTDFERAWTYGIRVPLNQNRGRAHDAFRYGVEGLRLLGYEMPQQPGKLTLGAELAKMLWLAKWHGPRHFLDLPRTEDPRKKAIMDIVCEMCPAAYYISQDLLSVMMLKSFSLSAQYGNAVSSPIGYGMYGMIMGPGFGNYKKGHAFGRMALELAEQFNNPKSKTFAYFMLAAFIAHWREPLDRCTDLCVSGYVSGFDSGSFSYGSYCAGLHTAIMTFKGDPLERLKEQCASYLEALKKTGSEDMALAITGVQRMALTLTGETKDPPGFSGIDFDEEAYVRGLREGKRFFLLCLYYTFKLPVLYLFGEHEQAIRIAEEVDAKANFLFGLFHSAHCAFYQALTAAALYAGSDAGTRKKHVRMIRRNRKRMKRWADNCPENFRNKYLLIAAELARLTGSIAEADELYEDSIRAARDQHFIHEEGLGNELAARFHLARGHTAAARAYLAEAIACYRKWGATAKIEGLEMRYQQLLGLSAGRAGERAASASDGIGASFPATSALDLATVLKTSQTISGEISLDRLLRQLMRIVIETAGAQRGVLILVRDGRLCMEAEGVSEEARYSVLPSLPVEGSGRVAESVVLYVARTEEQVILNNAADQGMFTHDPYIAKQRSRSILCLPIFHKRYMAGILYLENDLVSHSFTVSRVALLEALSAQIAISLENARFYEEAIRVKESLQESEQKFRTLAETMKAGIVIYRENRFLYVNPETEAITGYARDEFLKMNFADIIHPDHLQLVSTRAADRLAGRPVPGQYEYKIVRKDGRERWLMSTAGRILYGRDHAMIATLLDVTSQKEAEQERLRLYEENVRHYRVRIEEERRHQREKENIMMDIHDGIGGITTNIGLLAEVARKAPAPDEVKNRLSTISQLARDGSAEIRTLMFSMDNRDHTWQSVVAELRTHGGKMFRPHDIGFEMSIEIDETVPSPGSLLFLHLFRIYREALMNAVKHAQARTVSAGLRVDRERLLLTVRDDGRGCDPGSISGKGRGVNNMKTRAASIGGSLTITSDRGTCVSLEIPRDQLPMG